MNRHAFIPPLHEPAQRTIFIPTRRSLLQRLRPVFALLAVAAAIAGLVLATTWVIARMDSTQAQLQAAHAAGMAAGMRFCPER